MLTYIVKRVLLMIPTLLGMTFLLFAVVRFAPGLTTSGGQMNAGLLQSKQAQAQESRYLARRLHLVNRRGQPIALPLQYLLWVGQDVAARRWATLVGIGKILVHTIQVAEEGDSTKPARPLAGRAEIGDLGRFASRKKLAAYALLAPRS